MPAVAAASIALFVILKAMFLNPVSRRLPLKTVILSLATFLVLQAAYCGLKNPLATLGAPGDGVAVSEVASASVRTFQSSRTPVGGVGVKFSVVKKRSAAAFDAAPAFDASRPFEAERVASKGGSGGVERCGAGAWFGLGSRRHDIGRD